MRGTDQQACGVGASLEFWVKTGGRDIEKEFVGCFGVRHEPQGITPLLVIGEESLKVFG